MASLLLPKPCSAQPTESAELSQDAKRGLANKELQEVRVHVDESVHPPRTQQRATGGPIKNMPMASVGEWEQLTLRLLDTLSEAGDITHAAIPDPKRRALSGCSSGPYLCSSSMSF
jgi:hypothetical protein